ncbi:RTC4 domain-containing protein [Mycena venus]|uniref:Restriction of telomere capping protein 4 n=1 Tax=Mycena venus TaxID=2733690 RepID=A0A8H6YQV9_9AGAR|nr:RTC4 domain-containing protein [Mycena venus]
MFPAATTNTDSIQPFGLRDFIGQVLVPEVGMRLIMQDMRLDMNDPTDKNQGVAVMRDSASYGTSMFPEDSRAESDIGDDESEGVEEVEDDGNGDHSMFE